MTSFICERCKILIDFNECVLYKGIVSGVEYYCEKCWDKKCKEDCVEQQKVIDEEFGEKQKEIERQERRPIRRLFVWIRKIKSGGVSE